MSVNVGRAERIIRVVVGLALLSLLFLVGNDWRWVVIGLIPLLTGLAGWCPAYFIFGASTCSFMPRSSGR
jgi:hypothetical protein